MKAKLLSNDGSFVVDLIIPAFDKPPDIILWGTRHFMFKRVGLGFGSLAPYDDFVTYMEAFCYVTPLPQTDL